MQERVDYTGCKFTTPGREWEVLHVTAAGYGVRRWAVRWTATVGGESAEQEWSEHIVAGHVAAESAKEVK